jgi:hypothetical protein
MSNSIGPEAGSGQVPMNDDLDTEVPSLSQETINVRDPANWGICESLSIRPTGTIGWVAMAGEFESVTSRLSNISETQQKAIRSTAIFR